MEHKGKWKTAEGVCYGLIFGFMLALNFLTPYVADDYVYMVSFDTKELLTSLSQIPGSMYVHCLRMNGRVVSHTLEQLFMLMPKALFNLCNALVLTFLIRKMVRICDLEKKAGPLLPALLFMALWCTMPVFGQVMLWQVGALNYLWALAGCMLFVQPFWRWYTEGTSPAWGWIRGLLVCLGSVLFGMYSEMTSFVGIYLAAALLVLARVVKHRRIKTPLWVPLLCAAAGYVVLLSIPAEVAAKVSGGMDLSTLIANIIRAAGKFFLGCWHLFTLWSACFVMGILRKQNPDRLILSGLLFTGAAGSVCMTVIASYFPERCLATACILLILAVALLAAPSRNNGMTIVMTAVLTVWFAWACWTGTGDIVRCAQQFSAREDVIEQAKALGQRDLALEIVIPETPYSPFWDLRDLSCEEAETWPNSSMAKYYGVDSIIGKTSK